RVVAILVAKDQELVLALGDDQLVALDAGEGLEGRTRRPPAIGAMAVRGIEEFVRHGVVDGAAIAFSGKRAGARFLSVCHRPLLGGCGWSRAGAQLSPPNSKRS